MGKASIGILLAMLALEVPAAAQQPGPHDAASVPQVIRAQLVPRAFTTLSSETAARIERISHRAGERSQKGETLVEFDCVAQRAQVAKARAVPKAAEKTYAINSACSI